MATKATDFYTLGSEVLKGFVITARIGRGQYGEVWKVVETDKDREFAAKVINLQENDSALKEVRALKLVAKLNHIHLVNIHTFQVRQKNNELVPFKDLDQFVLNHKRKLKELVIIMELGDLSLSDRLKDYQEEMGSNCGLPIDELLRYMYGAARGIDYLYANNKIVHCDIKPANLLIFGQDVKVADCGVAVSISNGGTQTVALSPFYSPPELNRNRPGQWTDQYALAITYYQLRTGSLPFSPKLGQFDVMNLHDLGKLEFPSPILTPFELQAVKDATALIAADRFPNCESFVKQIDRAIKGDKPKRPFECTLPEIILPPKTTSGIIRQKEFRDKLDQNESGAVTFDKFRNTPEIPRIEIDELVEESNEQLKNGETIKPPPASDVDTDADMVPLDVVDTDDPLNENERTLQPNQRFNNRKNQGEAPKAGSSWNINIQDSPSTTRRQKSKPVSPYLPAFAISAVLLVVIGCIGFIIFNGRKTVASIEKVSTVEPIKTSEAVRKNPEIGTTKTTPVETISRLSFVDFVHKIGSDTFEIERNLEEAYGWLESEPQKKRLEEDRRLAKVILAEVREQSETSQRLQAELNQYEDNLQAVRYLHKLCDMRKRTPALFSNSWEAADGELIAWKKNISVSFLDRRHEAVIKRLNEICQQLERSETVTLQDRLDYIDWREQNEESLHLSMGLSSIEKLWVKTLSTAKPTEQVKVLDFALKFPDSTNKRYAMIGRSEKKKLAEWDFARVADRLTKERDDRESKLESLDEAVVTKWKEEFEKAAKVEIHEFQKRHPDLEQTWDSSKIGESKVVALWMKVSKAPGEHFQELRDSLLDRTFKDRPLLERTLARNYMAWASGAMEPIEKQREVRSHFRDWEDINQQFQINLSISVKDELRADRRINSQKIQNICGKDDLANGWREAAFLEVLIQERIAELTAAKKLPEFRYQPVKTLATSDQELNRYSEYLNNWASYLAIRKPKRPISPIEPYPEIEASPNARLKLVEEIVNSFEKTSFKTSYRKKLVADETLGTLLAIPQPPEKPLEAFAKNPYKSAKIDNVNIVTGLFKKIEHDFKRELTPTELAHYVMALYATPESDERHVIAAEILTKRKPSLPDVPDGSVHPCVGTAFFSMKYQANDSADSMFSLIRYWVSDSRHFIDAKKDSQGVKRTRERWSKVKELIKQTKSPRNDSNKHLYNFYDIISDMYISECSLASIAQASQLLSSLDNSALPDFEASMSFAWQSFASLLSFRDYRDSGNESVKNEQTQKWQNTFEMARKSISLRSNAIAVRILAFKDFAEGETRSYSPVKSPLQIVDGSFNEDRLTRIKQTKKNLDDACSLLLDTPFSEYWMNRTTYTFFWGMQLGKAGLIDLSREFLEASLFSIEKVINQVDVVTYDLVKQKASILEDLAWLCNFNRSQNYQEALSSIEKLFSADFVLTDTQKDSLLVDMARMLLRAHSQNAISAQDFDLRIQFIKSHVESVRSKSLNFRFYNALLAEYISDLRDSNKDLLSICMDMTENNSDLKIRSCVVVGERFFAMSKSGAISMADMSGYQSACEALKSDGSSSSCQIIYAKAILSSLKGDTADSAAMAKKALADLELMYDSHTISMDWPYAIHIPLFALESGLFKNDPQMQRNTLRLLERMTLRFPNHISKLVSERISTVKRMK